MRLTGVTARSKVSARYTATSAEFARVRASDGGQDYTPLRAIATFPLSGRVVPEFNGGQLREVFQRPYRIIYHVRPDKIEVVAIVHISRRIEENPEGELKNVS